METPALRCRLGTTSLQAFVLNAPAWVKQSPSALNAWGGLVDEGVQEEGTAPQVFVNIVESFTEQTPFGERDIKNSALVIYDKHGNTTELVLKQKVEEWNLLGWYQGKNPQQTTRVDLVLSDLSAQMMDAIITSSDYHCQGCLLGPVLVPVEGRNRLNATSSGSSSKRRNMQRPLIHPEQR